MTFLAFPTYFTSKQWSLISQIKFSVETDEKDAMAIYSHLLLNIKNDTDLQELLLCAVSMGNTVLIKSILGFNRHDLNYRDPMGGDGLLLWSKNDETRAILIRAGFKDDDEF